MFHEARIKLTAWYLLIIMAISLSFSGVIYVGVNNELARIESFQRTRIQRIVQGFPAPLEVSQTPDADAINESRLRIITTLALINFSILILSGIGGYFLAGLTLDPIAEMVDEQKEFISNASHELRTPLTSLMTEIEVSLRDKGLGLGQAKKLLESNLEDVRNMNKLSNYLLKLNKLGDGSAKLEFKKVDLEQIVEKAAENFNVKFNLELSKSEVVGNEESLTELVTILLDNAIKYSKKGGKIIVKTSGKTLTVQDFGIGIPDNDLPHIFDRFYRADSSRNKVSVDGYGLGLSIAKNIIDSHKANIKVESEEGKGTIFTVTF